MRRTKTGRERPRTSIFENFRDVRGRGRRGRRRPAEACFKPRTKDFLTNLDPLNPSREGKKVDDLQTLAF